MLREVGYIFKQGYHILHNFPLTHHQAVTNGDLLDTQEQTSMKI